MRPRLLLIITQDPRCSHLPAEAVRIAAGVGAWRQVEVSVYLLGKAVASLADPSDDLRNEDVLSQFWPVVAGFGRPIYIPRAELERVNLKRACAAYKAIDEVLLAALIATSQTVLSF